MNSKPQVKVKIPGWEVHGICALQYALKVMSGFGVHFDTWVLYVIIVIRSLSEEKIVRSFVDPRVCCLCSLLFSLPYRLHKSLPAGWCN